MDYHGSTTKAFVWEAISKTCASCFITISKHSKTIKALGLRPRAFICFLVFGNRDETLALVFEIVQPGPTLHYKRTTSFMANKIFLIHLSWRVKFEWLKPRSCNSQNKLYMPLGNEFNYNLAQDLKTKAMKIPTEMTFCTLDESLNNVTAKRNWSPFL